MTYILIVQLAEDLDFPESADTAQQGLMDTGDLLQSCSLSGASVDDRPAVWVAVQTAMNIPPHTDRALHTSCK